MEQHDVERIVRGVLSDVAAPCTLLSVDRREAGWQALLKAMNGHVISVTLPDGPAPAIRRALVQRVEAETDVDA